MTQYHSFLRQQLMSRLTMIFHNIKIVTRPQFKTMTSVKKFTKMDYV